MEKQVDERTRIWYRVEAVTRDDDLRPIYMSRFAVLAVSSRLADGGAVAHRDCQCIIRMVQYLAAKVHRLISRADVAQPAEQLIRKQNRGDSVNKDQIPKPFFYACLLLFGGLH
jgi:hypothetical protein